ncbi:glycosyltransferase [Mycolicibacterium psychrotolerans]|uniref:glycosyltransferase n=1 Tax=Mycolicibacterium psychrotolerans TaxID=216929 RepID=UPI003D669BE2
MKFVLANWGSRGEVEPFAAIGRELVRRGHDVSLVVAPDMVGFAESAGPVAVAYGPAVQDIIESHHDYFTLLFSKPWRLGELNRLVRSFAGLIDQYRESAGKTLMSLADGADVLLTGMNYEGIAANVAEYHNVPLATLQIFPLRANGRLVPFLPVRLGRLFMTGVERLTWRGHRVNDDSQRRELGLSKATAHWTGRIDDGGAMEIQAYDEVCYPGLADDWATWNAQSPPRRPFVGALTLELPAKDDLDVKDWIAAGTPPIFFSFGSMPVESARDTIAMIAGACAQLGERALVGAGSTDFSDVPQYEHLKIVGAVNYPEVLPACRAVVHHGGAGTTNAGLRAGRPTLILWILPDQGFWGARLKRLGVGTSRRLVATTEKSLVADLRKILTPECRDRARELAVRMTRPADSIAAAADLMENFAHARRARTPGN